MFHKIIYIYCRRHMNKDKQHEGERQTKITTKYISLTVDTNLAGKGKTSFRRYKNRPSDSMDSSWEVVVSDKSVYEQCCPSLLSTSPHECTAVITVNFQTSISCKKMVTMHQVNSICIKYIQLPNKIYIKVQISANLKKLQKYNIIFTSWHQSQSSNNMMYKRIKHSKR